MTAMWIDACEILNRTERLRRQIFSLVDTPEQFACWEPPVDIFEANGSLQVIALLPGVAADQLTVEVVDDVLSISGKSPFPVPAMARIHRLEIPYGAFQKRLQLPSRLYQIKSSEYRDGCLSLILTLPP